MDLMSELHLIRLMNFRSVCFCLLQQPWQFMTLLRYLSPQDLKADMLMISILVSGFHFSDLKFITWRTHTPLRAFAVLFMTVISSRHRPFWQTGCLVVVFFVVLFDSAATCHWSTELIRATKTPPSSFTTKPSHLPCLRLRYNTSADWVEFHSVLFLHCGSPP